MMAPVIAHHDHGNQDNHQAHQAEGIMSALTAALTNRGSATRDWAVGWLQRSGMTKPQASAEVDRAKAQGEVVEHEGVLVPAVKPNPTKGQPMKSSNASKQADLARARSQLAEKRLQVVRQAKVAKARTPRQAALPMPRARQPKAMTLAQMAEHNRRTALPTSAKLVRPKIDSFQPRHEQENPMAKLSSAQKAALKRGREALAKMRASAKKATSKKPTPKKATSKKASVKKPTGKKKATSKQIRAMAKARAARAANIAARAAAAPSAGLAAMSAPSAAPKKRKTRKPRKAPSKAASGTAKKTNRVSVARQAIARADRALAPRPKPRKKGQKPPKSISSGTYTNRGGQSIIVRRTYRANPVVEFRQIALAGGGLALGWIAAEMADRYVATRAPKPAVEGQETKPLRDGEASQAIQKLADGTRLLVSGGGTLAFGLGAYMLRDRAPDVAYAVGGLGAGFGIKFFSQVLGDVIFPALFKIKPEDKEDSFSRRMFPDKQKPAETPASGAVTGRLGAGWGNWGPNRRVFYPGRPAFSGFTGAPQGQSYYPFVDAPAQTAPVGPVATGAVGCGCGSSTSRAWQNKCGSEMMPGWGNGGCSTCAQPPVPVAPPNGLIPGAEDGRVPGTEDGSTFSPWPFSIVESPRPEFQVVGDRASLTAQENDDLSARNLALRARDISSQQQPKSLGYMAGPAEQTEQEAAPQEARMDTATIVSMMNRRRRRK